MKSNKIMILTVTLMILLAFFSFADENKIGLTVNPYFAANVGNVAATSFSPVFTIDTFGL